MQRVPEWKISKVVLYRVRKGSPKLISLKCINVQKRILQLDPSFFTGIYMAKASGVPVKTYFTDDHREIQPMNQGFHARYIFAFET